MFVKKNQNISVLLAHYWSRSNWDKRLLDVWHNMCNNYTHLNLACRMMQTTEMFGLCSYYVHIGDFPFSSLHLACCIPDVHFYVNILKFNYFGFLCTLTVVCIVYLLCYKLHSVLFYYYLFFEEVQIYLFIQ